LGYVRGLHSTDIITNVSVTGVGDPVTGGQQDRYCWEMISTLNLAVASLSHSTYLHRTACITPSRGVVFSLTIDLETQVHFISQYWIARKPECTLERSFL